jgi:tRNA 2-thiouridine synthesizing protein A
VSEFLNVFAFSTEKSIGNFKMSYHAKELPRDGVFVLSPDSELPYHAQWDAGDLGCGELVMDLMLRMRKLETGQVLRLTATDAGAPSDIPAWCRMTGHILQHADAANHFFFIQRN